MPAVTTRTGDLVDALLGGAGAVDAPALLAPGWTVSYGELRRRVGERRQELDLGPRAVVLLAATNTVEFVVTYLALLDAGHVPLLAGDHLDRLAAVWRPAATITTSATGIDVRRHRHEDRSLHPDLRLLLSTSGSTGSPKLVRLSDRNLTSNAVAIAASLGLGPDDRSITSLPLHYCYGLSVVHSHLAAGASVVLTDASVVDPCFQRALVEHAVTNVAGVPHSFELLERAGPERLRVPSLRFVTCAGGRLAPPRVRRWLDRTASWGADFVVMYGQTEATARIAYLPPALAHRHPDAIGVPVPGGALHLRAVDGAEPGVGELVYRGDNVMLGYAETDVDLATGATIDELATGDLARYRPDDGVFAVVGRRSRFVKPFGLRIDLDVVEREVTERFGPAAVTGDDDRIVVAAPAADPSAVAATVARLTKLPAARVLVDADRPIPRTTTGKVAYDELRQRLRQNTTDAPPASPAGETSVAAVYAEILGRDVEPADTFVGLGGDSLSYVECSVRLEAVLGRLPADWHLRPVGELEATRPATRDRRSRLDTTVVLRAVGILAVVATHMHLVFFPGGAHLLLAVAGYNLSRFLLPIESGAARVRAGLRTISRAAVPAIAWTAIGIVVFGAYSWGTLALVNTYIGPSSHADDHWHFWFIEVFVHLVAITTLVVAIPAVRRVERRWPYAVAGAALALMLVLRTDWAQWFDPGNMRFRTHAIAWFFVLGWLVHASSTWWRRGLTTVVVVLTVPGFFERPQREAFIAAGLVALLWLPQLPWPRLLVRPVAAIGAASLWILISHFTIWPLLTELMDRRLAYVLTVGAGVMIHAVAEHGTRWVTRRRIARRAAGPWPVRQVVRAATISS